MILAFGVLMLSCTAVWAGSSPRVIACYKEVQVPAKYQIKKVLIKKAEQKYLKKGDMIRLVEYPAIYREDKKLVAPAHVLMREVPCN
jgi:hypothetical protein